MESAIYLPLLLCFFVFLCKAENKVIKSRRGSVVTLPCDHGGINRANIDQVLWFKGTQSLLSWSNIGVTSTAGTDPKAQERITIIEADFSLRLNSVVMEDSGQYKCYVEYTSGNDTLMANSTLLLTIQDVPSPPGKPIISNIQSRSFHVTFTASALSNNSPIKYYNVHVIQRGGNWENAISFQVHATSNLSNILISSAGIIRPYRNYVVRVSAINEIGNSSASEETEVQTAEDEPLAKPTILEIRNLTNSSVQLHWQDPSPDTLNGELLGYKIVYKRHPEGNLHPITVPNPDEKFCNITHLKPHTRYLVALQLYNKAGESPKAEEIFLTDEGVPNRPRITDISNQTSTSFVVAWVIPTEPNGIITSYKVRWNETDSSGNRIGQTKAETIRVEEGFKPTMKIRWLKPYTDYTVRVVAHTSKGEGEESVQQSVITDVSNPGRPQRVLVKQNETGSVLLTWHSPISFTRHIDRYLIKYYKEEDGALGAVEKTLDVNPERREDARNEPEEFALHGLEEGVVYKFSVAAATKSLFSSEYKIGQYTVPVTLTLEGKRITTDAPEPAMGLAAILGVIAAVAVILIVPIVLAIVFLLRRKKNYQETATKGSDDNISQPLLLMELYGRSNYESVSIENWADHVRKMHADGDLRFSEEYDDINNSVNKNITQDAAYMDENKPKNRYVNILPFDHTRVVLKPMSKHNDYINANFVDGYHKAKAYIATQGPLPNTFEDFWRMVWDQNSVIVVMITNLEEKGRRKCDKYWPNEVGHTETYGNMQVEYLDEDERACYTIRKFCLRNQKAKRVSTRVKHSAFERIIYQYHYTDWPDHGVPDYTLPVLTLVQKSSRHNPEGAGPIIVHCSAGVGRTGTYIVLDSMIRQILDKRTVNVCGFLTHIRHQRSFLVQTEDQYIFIHDALLEYIQKDGDTEVLNCKLKEFVEENLTFCNAEGECLLDRQYQLVTEYKPKDHEFSPAHMIYNKNKNRSERLLPVDKSRVHLPKQPGIDGSDYINATFLQGYFKINEFVITQHPLGTTQEDFWRMVWDQNSATIVMLSEVTKDGEFPEFWQGKDETQEIDSGNFKVTQTGEDFSQIHNITRDFLIESKQDDYELTSRIISTTAWPESCTPLHTVLEFIDTVDSWHKEHQNGPIIVIDKEGGSVAGTFCALYSLNNQRKHEDGVDVYSLAKTYHLMRPGIFSSKDDYHFLYKVMGSIVESQPDILMDIKGRIGSSESLNHGNNGQPLSTWAHGLSLKRNEEQTTTTV
ncbi:receptor-type tyrosine-protein phosphatase delta [Lingula anatina]|uniref:protein-tyrosine-phosphatase n=1 Tax=Lingula anatina TaxID=7574 RepID=A0A1S3H5S6_LINAN|nr:receptor-type tyrosine-protein phosphatase delta [Lingula anatina]|eukprot:XP_013380826.1 receptor-type tyrosine-protein phosphatase delta [Lingula anatina]